MLRSISKDVQLTLSTLNAQCSTRHRLLLARHYSPLSPTPDSETKRQPPPLAAAPKKVKLDLRPAPLKPKATQQSLPNAPARANPVTKAPEHITLATAKKTVEKDISDAQRHGIIPPPPPNAGWAKQTLHKLIELAKFYYRGVKLIFLRHKEIAAIQARVASGGAPLTRSEFRLIHTQKDDINKVVPFIILALLLEEVIPIIAIYAPSLLPSTCILPSQRERIEAKRAEKALASAVSSSSIFAALKQRESTSSQIPLSALKEVDGAPTTLCSMLGLSTLGIDALRIQRIRKHLQFIAEDDKHLTQDQITLSDHEVKEALAERGLLSSAKATFVDKQNLLNWWLTSPQSQASEDAVPARLALVISRQ